MGCGIPTLPSPPDLGSANTVQHHNYKGKNKDRKDLCFYVTTYDWQHPPKLHLRSAGEPRHS